MTNVNENTVVESTTEAVSPVECLVMLSFDDALKIAKGCFDYGGGYRSNDKELEIYHHGIQTVVNALESANKKGLSDMQVKVLHIIGSKT